MSHIAKGVGILTDSCMKFNVFDFLRPISPHDVQLYALRDEIEHSKRFYLSLCGSAKKRRPKKADKSNYWTFIQHKYDES